MSFDDFYQQNPFGGFTRNEREWFVPELLSAYVQNSIWRSFVPSQVEITRTNQMTFSMLGGFEPNINPINFYELYIAPMFADSRQLSLTTLRYAGKMQVYRQDDFMNYWQENNVRAMSAIVRNRFAPSIVTTLDKLARNAFLQTHFKSYAMDNANTGFDDIVAGDRFNLDWIDNIQLRLATLGLPGFDGTPGTIACVTSPGSLYEIRKHADWEEYNKYTPEGRNTLLTGVVGRIRGVYFIPHNSAILWNAGTITKQAAITTPVTAGSGAAAAVHGWVMGQAGAVPYIQLDDVTNLAANDVVTVHKVRTSAHGVTNGVDPYDGMTFSRTIYSVDAVNKRISFTEPLLWDFATDLGGSVYGYVTKGLHIHTSTFIAGPGAVVMGVTEPIRLHEPEPDDDFKSVYRLSWDGFFKFSPFRDEWAYPVFHAGYHSIDGSLATGA